MREVLLVSVGGALGALGRYGVSRAMIRLIGQSFPYGTLAVNCVGSFLIGLLMQRLLGSDLVPSSLRLALIVGFLGAFTTFSTFSYETVNYFRNGSWYLGAANIAANMALGIGFVLAGMAIARYVFKVA
jgi:CrcB protein